MAGGSREDAGITEEAEGILVETPRPGFGQPEFETDVIEPSGDGSAPDEERQQPQVDQDIKP
jgi:hypothetical protein